MRIFPKQGTSRLPIAAPTETKRPAEPSTPKRIMLAHVDAARVAGLTSFRFFCRRDLRAGWAAARPTPLGAEPAAARAAAKTVPVAR